MNIGFLTSCLPEVAPPELFRWAGQNGFGAVEIWAGAQDAEAGFCSGGGINPQAADPQAADQLSAAARESGVTISCLTWCANMLDPRADVRSARLERLLSVVEAAALLDVDVVSCFAGRNPEKPVEQSLDDFKEVFEQVMAAAAERGVRIAVENCPAVGEEFEGLAGNIAYSPPLWRRMFEAFPEMGLNFDPSHLVWMGIDHAGAAAEFAKHIYHVHAKDTELLEHVLADRGILPPAGPRPVLRPAQEQGGAPLGEVTDPPRPGNPDCVWPAWWRYRLPGFGVIDWPRLVSVLVENGYDGTLSIEHEDPVFSGDGDKVRRGLQIARRRLEPLIG